MLSALCVFLNQMHAVSEKGYLWHICVECNAWDNVFFSKWAVVGAMLLQSWKLRKVKRVMIIVIMLCSFEFWPVMLLLWRWVNCEYCVKYGWFDIDYPLIQFQNGCQALDEWWPLSVASVVQGYQPIYPTQPVPDHRKPLFVSKTFYGVVELYSHIPRTWGQRGAHLGPPGPRWAPCWPHIYFATFTCSS